MKKLLKACVIVGLLLMAREALAQQSMPAPMPEPATSPQPAQVRLLVPQGMSISVGGGVAGFIDGDARDFTGTAGTWEARVGFGTRWPVTIEGAYVGSAQNVDALGLDSSSVLLGTSLEANARLNILQGPVQPFVLAGAGWQHYSITNSSFNTSDVQDTTNGFSVPLGAGVAYKYRRLIVDARGVIRPVFGDDLVPQSTTQSSAARLDNWSAILRAGFEF